MCCGEITKKKKKQQGLFTATILKQINTKIEKISTDPTNRRNRSEGNK